MQARDAGVDLFFAGSNEVYWKVRFENGPGGADRMLVCYKTHAERPPIQWYPHGHMARSRRRKQPRERADRRMYVGDNDFVLPALVSAAEGADRVYRYTGLDTRPRAPRRTSGASLIGWEWDARVANGSEPAGVKTLAARR